MESVVSQSRRSTSLNLQHVSRLTSSLIFTFFDQVCQHTEVPPLITIIIYLYISFQITIANLWETSFLDKIAFFADKSTDVEIIGSILIIISFICLFSFLFPLAFYKTQRRFLKWSLYLSRISFDYIIPILLIPISAELRIILLCMINGKSKNTDIVILVLLAISYISILGIFIVSQDLISNTAFMSRSPIYTYSSKPLVFILVLNSLMNFFFHLFSLMPHWALIIMAVTHALLTLYPIFLLYNLPYFRFQVNDYLMAMMISLIVLDILFIAGLKFLIRGICFLPVMAIFWIVLGIINYNRVKNAKKLLSPELEEGETFTDYLSQLHIEMHASLLLHVGIKYHSHLFINFTLMKYLMDHNVTQSVLAECLRSIVPFPSQSSLLNYVFIALDKNSKLPYSKRFLLFQVYRIKLLRQSSSSAAASIKFEEMRSINRGLRNRTSSFWANDNPTIGGLAALQKDISKSSTRWEENIKDFPNSQMHREEYIKFLVDVKAEFDEACKHHYVISLIESGKNFSVDYCFRSFVQVCPQYIKQHIVDIQGNFFDEMKKKKGTQSSSNRASNEFLSTSSMDAKLEETIAKSLIRQARMRIALQSALKTRKNNNMNKYGVVTVIFIVISLVAFSAFYGIFQNKFDDRYDGLDRTTVLNEAHLEFSLTGFFEFVAWANISNRFDPSKALLNITEKIETKSYWNGEPFTSSLAMASTNSRKNFDTFINLIAALSLTDVNIYTLTGVLLNESLKMLVCVDNKPSDPIDVNLRVFYLNLLSSFSLMYTTGVPYENWWSMNEYWCKGFISFDDIEDGFATLRANLLQNEFDTAEKERSMLEIIVIASPVIFAVILIIPSTILLVLAIKETKSLMRFMMLTGNEHKTEATKTLLRNENTINDAVEQVTESTGQALAEIIFDCVLTYIFKIAMVAVLTVLLMQCDDINTKFEYMYSWTEKSYLRGAKLVEMTICAYESSVIVGNGSISQGMFNLSYLTKRVSLLVDDIERLRTELVSSDDHIRSILGFDDEIDNLLYRANCEPTVINTTLHDMYDCGSIHQQIAWVENVAKETTNTAEIIPSTIDTDNAMNMFHIMVAHILPQLKELNNLLIRLMTKFMNDYHTNLVILFVVGLVLTILEMVIEIYFIKLLDEPYQACITLIKRLNPVSIVNNTKLIDYILNKNSERISSEMTTTRAAIHNSADAIFLISQSGSIESVNVAVTKILGYTPEQLLGQHFNVIFDDGDNDKVSQQLNFMISKQSGPSYDDHFHCLSDTEQVIPCFTMLFGMSNGNEHDADVDSFVAVLRDETVLIDHQLLAEKAKKQSEDLLYQILPRDIVIRLNQGEKDISFQVPSSSIMFIDIVKFSDYSASLTPSEIMGTLSSLFGSFDEAANKYPLITKIKLIGDVYICAAGLFAPDEQPQYHAEQLLKFGLDSLQIVDETNIRLTANLSVRIGMNSDGPLIAGVLGTDKPVFDIIGDPINIASRLQSTDIPGRIQISQSSFDLINGMDFSVEQRGEIFLKGKGKTKAFLVKPLDAIISHSSILG